MNRKEIAMVVIGIAIGMTLAGTAVFIINPWGLESALLIGGGIGMAIVTIPEMS